MTDAEMVKKIEDLAEIIIQRGVSEPLDMAIILDSGLSGVIDGSEGVAIPYADLPGFPKGKISEASEGCLIFRKHEGRNVAYLQGRSHFYDVGDVSAMQTPLEVLAMLGAQTVIVTSLSCSTHMEICPGGIVLVTDHINFGGINPLIGLAAENGFVNMQDAYDPKLLRRIKRAAALSGVHLHEAVYMWFSGPSYETAAEIKLANALGAGVVGMSVAPEVILGRRLGLTMAGVSVVTHYGAGLSANAPMRSEALAQAQAGSVLLRRLLRTFIKASETSGLNAS